MDPQVHEEGESSGYPPAPDFADSLATPHNGKRSLVEVLKRSRGAPLSSLDGPSNVAGLLDRYRGEARQRLAIGAGMGSHVPDDRNLWVVGHRAVRPDFDPSTA